MNQEICQELVGIVFNYLQDCNNRKLIDNIHLVADTHNLSRVKVYNIVTDCIDKYSIKLSQSIINLRCGYDL